jgi:hypothetical protein
LKSWLKISGFEDNDKELDGLEVADKGVRGELGQVEILEWYVYCYIATIYCL